MHIFVALLSAWLTGSVQFALAQDSSVEERPVQSEILAPTEPIELLPAGMTNQISRDLNDQSAAFADLPDRSFRTLWLRIFPLLHAPLGDPYPETKNVNLIDLQNDDGLNIYRLDNGALLGNTKALHLDFSKATFAIGGANVPMMALWIVPAGAALTTTHWDKGATGLELQMKLRGGFAVDKTTFNIDPEGNQIPNPVPQWSVMNVLDVEKYLLAVVPSEVLSSWHPSMLQAQAIAARTYSYYQMSLARLKGRNWDMDPSTSFQSYRGAQFAKGVGAKFSVVETSATTAATVATAGQVIVYNGEVINAYFSGNSGGITCTARECFNQQDVPYLQQVSDAPGVTARSGGTWGTKANITASTVSAALKSVGVKLPSAFSKLEPLRKGPSGRTWQLRVKMKKGSLDLTETQTRKVMSTFGAIRSFLHKLGAVTKGKQSIVGHGYGHGVGLSQEGGQIFATKGWSPQKILVYFYPNTQIKVL